jgi:ankyrin repeat protein
MEKNDNKLLRQYFKSYLDGKTMFDTNKEKSLELLKESLTILNLLKNNVKINDKYNKLLEESENESYKLIGQTIEDNIESEITISNNKISSETLLNALEKGELIDIKKAKYGEIDFNKRINNKTILHYAINFSDTTFLKLAFKLGARIDITDSDGHTLLEYACLELDPNMINFLVKYGADLKKHLYFRDGNQKKHVNLYDSIDILIIYKILLAYNNNKIEFVNNKLLNWLYIYLNSIDIDSSLCYLDIILEELNFTLLNKLGCPRNKIEIMLTNLVPFIDNYPFNLSIDWILSLELKYLIKKIIKNKINSSNIKLELINLIWENYIKKNIVTEDYIGILISQWIEISKIKV